MPDAGSLSPVVVSVQIQEVEDFPSDAPLELSDQSLWLHISGSLQAQLSLCLLFPHSNGCCSCFWPFCLGCSLAALWIPLAPPLPFCNPCNHCDPQDSGLHCSLSLLSLLILNCCYCVLSATTAPSTASQATASVSHVLQAQSVSQVMN